MSSNASQGVVHSYRTDWGKSDAKKRLEKLIEVGQVTRNTDANYVYEHMCDGIFKAYKKTNFKTNLRNLLSKVEKNKQKPTLLSPSEEARNVEETFLSDWGKSDAKQRLQGLIEDGQVTEDTDANYVYEHMCDGIFKNYKKTNFKTNLRNLLSRVERNKQRLARDNAAFHNDLAIVGRPTTSYRGGPVWRGSEASRLLEDDVRNGRHRGISLELLRQGNGEYSKFGSTEFQEHVRQLERKFRGRGYWLKEAEERRKMDNELRDRMAGLNIKVAGRPM